MAFASLYRDNCISNRLCDNALVHNKFRGQRTRDAFSDGPNEEISYKWTVQVFAKSNVCWRNTHPYW